MPGSRSSRRVWMLSTQQCGSSKSGLVMATFLLLVMILGLLQLWLLHNTTPPPDGIAYFEVADQIPRVGYGKALPQHWSPLYPLYLLATRTVAPASLDRELRVPAGAAPPPLPPLPAAAG